MPGGLVGLVIFDLIVGIILWIFPIEGTMKKIVIGVVAIINLLWLVNALGWVSINLR